MDIKVYSFPINDLNSVSWRHGFNQTGSHIRLYQGTSRGLCLPDQHGNEIENIFFYGYNIYEGDDWLGIFII